MNRITLTPLLLLGVAFAGGYFLLPAPAAATRKHGTYTTEFRLTESPISEGGNWINGKAAGLDWSDVATVTGLAFGVESVRTATMMRRPY